MSTTNDGDKRINTVLDGVSNWGVKLVPAVFKRVFDAILLKKNHFSEK